MTIHPSAPDDAARKLKEAVRCARAASHSRQLDTAVQSAFNAFDDAMTAVVDYVRTRDAEVAQLQARIVALESTRVAMDP